MSIIILMANYVCVEPIGNTCNQWAVQESLLDSLAITQQQAGELAVAICGLMILGFILGEMAHLAKTLK